MAKILKPQSLRIGNDITVRYPGGYSGSPMRFLGLSYPLMFVEVDIYKNGSYKYHTSFDLSDGDTEVHRVPKSYLESIKNSNK